MNEPNKKASSSMGLEGSLPLTVVAIAAGLLLAIGVAVAAWAWIQASYADMSYDWVASQVFGVVAFVGALVAVAGMIMRAAAHNRADQKNQDYLGKLFAAATAGFVLVAAEQKIDPAIYTTVAGLTVAVSLFAIAICTRILGNRRHAK